MQLSEYQQAAHRTSLEATYGDGDLDALIYPTLKLAGEAGEFAEKVGKLIRDQGGPARPGRTGGPDRRAGRCALVRGRGRDGPGAGPGRCRRR